MNFNFYKGGADQQLNGSAIGSNSSKQSSAKGNGEGGEHKSRKSIELNIKATLDLDEL